MKFWRLAVRCVNYSRS